MKRNLVVAAALATFAVAPSAHALLARGDWAARLLDKAKSVTNSVFDKIATKAKNMAPGLAEKGAELARSAVERVKTVALQQAEKLVNLAKEASGKAREALVARAQGYVNNINNPTLRALAQKGVEIGNQGLQKLQNGLNQALDKGLAAAPAALDKAAGIANEHIDQIKTAIQEKSAGAIDYARQVAQGKVDHAAGAVVEKMKGVVASLKSKLPFFSK